MDNAPRPAGSTPGPTLRPLRRCEALAPTRGTGAQPYALGSNRRRRRRWAWRERFGIASISHKPAGPLATSISRLAGEAPPRPRDNDRSCAPSRTRLTRVERGQESPLCARMLLAFGERLAPMLSVGAAHAEWRANLKRRKSAWRTAGPRAAMGVKPPIERFKGKSRNSQRSAPRPLRVFPRPARFLRKALDTQLAKPQASGPGQFAGE